MGKRNPNSYYHADALLSKKDLNGNTPEIFCVCGNRSGGKTTDFTLKIAQGWLDNEIREFMLLKRYANECPGAGIDFLNKDFVDNFFPTILEFKNIYEKRDSSGFVRIFADDTPIGWVVPINTADKVKKKSQLFNNVDVMFFDEFMPETGVYCPNEIAKIKSIHVSVARAYGQQSRYVPLYMASNLISVLNPYFSAWGIASRINTNTRFIRGVGVVVEQNYNKAAAKAQAESAFLQAFSSGEDNNYYTDQGVYLLDNISMVGKLTGKSDYICNLFFNNKYYAIKLMENGVLYCCKKVNIQYPCCLSVTRKDISEDKPYKDFYPTTITYIRSYFNSGLFRFEDQEAKECIFKLLAY